jgi:hypothetical protein
LPRFNVYCVYTYGAAVGSALVLGAWFSSLVVYWRNAE